MSNEIAADAEKVPTLDGTHIRSMVILALFGFVFLGTEFFFDSRAAEVVDARKVLLYQSMILLASVVGIFLYALIQKNIGDNAARKITVALNIVGIFALAAVMLGNEKGILLCGILFFIIWGVTGGFVYYVVAEAYTERKHLTVTVGTSYALGLFLQYINYNIIDSMAIRFVMFTLAVVVLMAILMIYVREEYAHGEIKNGEHITDISISQSCIEKSDETTRNSRAVLFAMAMVILLMTFIFSELDNIVTFVHAKGGADVGQWPRLFLALSGIIAGVLFDIKDQWFMNQMMYCVTVLSVIAMLVIEFGGAFIIGLIVFYLAAGFFVVYFTTGFIEVSYSMKWQSLWTGAGRALNNIGAGIVGVISYLLIDTPNILKMSIIVLLLLVLISIAVFVLDNLQKRQYGHHDKENVREAVGHTCERTDSDFACFANTHRLTEREREVLQKLLISDGSVQEIADSLYISRTSLYRHISSMNDKTGTKSRVGLIQYYYGWHEDRLHMD